MKSYIATGAALVLASLMSVGCSSTDSGTEAMSGYLIDSAVAGVQYESESGLNGTTDLNGTFRFRVQEKVRFRIGNLELGESMPDLDQYGVITPEMLCDQDQNRTDLMLRTLQALDEDSNLSNGIQIPEEILARLQEIEQVRFADLNESELLKLDPDFAQKIDANADGVIDISAVQARLHFQNSKKIWSQYGPRANNQNSYSPNGINGGWYTNFDPNATGMSTLTQELKDAIAYMGNEERLAHDVYTNLYDYHQQNGTTIMQLANIAERSEMRHIEIVQSLVRKYNLTDANLTNVDSGVADSSVDVADMPSGQYDIPAIQSLYDALYAKGQASQRDALEVGCMVEVTDINDLDEKIKLAQESNAPDVEEAFDILRSGSYSHYWAFDAGLKNIGVAEGCCSLGTIDGVNYCHDEYPSGR